MKLHHWFITGIVALLTIGCATTDSQRDYFGLELLLTERQSDSTAVGLWLVVDNAERYELDEKAVKLTLAPGQHRIDLVEDPGASPIDSICTSSNISLEADFTVSSSRLRIGEIEEIKEGGTVEVNGTTISSCAPIRETLARKSSEPVAVQDDVEDQPCATPSPYSTYNSDWVTTRDAIIICGRYTFTSEMLDLFEDETETNRFVNEVFNDRGAVQRSRISACIQRAARAYEDFAPYEDLASAYEDHVSDEDLDPALVSVRKQIDTQIFEYLTQAARLTGVLLLVKDVACYDGSVSAL